MRLSMEWLLIRTGNYLYLYNPSVYFMIRYFPCNGDLGELSWCYQDFRKALCKILYGRVIEGLRFKTLSPHLGTHIHPVVKNAYLQGVNYIQSEQGNSA